MSTETPAEAGAGSEAAATTSDRPGGTTGQLASDIITPKQLQLVVIGLMIALFLAGLDNSIVATAMPTIAGQLGGFSKLAWVSTAYILTSAIATPLLGKLSDLFGRRKLFLISVAVFLFGSALCGAAGSINQLIIFRGIQGIGGGGIQALAFAIIGELVPPRQRGRYMGLFTSAYALSSVTGPLVGGWIVQNISWRWIFYVNLPVGAVALLVTSSVLKLPFHKIDAKVDYLGAITMSASIVSLLVALELGRDNGWTSPSILGLFAASVIFLVLFVLQERRAEEPMVPLRLLQDRVVAMCCIIGFLLGTTMFGASLYFSVFFQDVRFISPTGSGLRALPTMAGILFGSTFIGRRITATGRYKIYPVIGSLILTGGVLVVVAGDITPSTGYLRIGLAMALMGLGMGSSMPAVSIAPQNAVALRDLGITTATVTFFRTLGGSVALAFYGTIFNSVVARELPRRIPPGTVKAGTDLSKIIRTPAQIKASPAALRDAIRGSITAGINRVFLFAIVFTFLAFVFATRLEERPLRTTMEHTPTIE